MKKFILDENEVVRILNMHKLLKEQDSLGATTPTTLSTPAITKSEVSVDPRQVLINARNNFCLKNGQLGKNHPRTKGPYYRAKKQSTGQEVDFFPDMTYEFVDGSKKGKWSCEKSVTQTTSDNSLEQKKRDYIKYYTTLGYKENLTAQEMASDEFQKVKIRGSEQLFGPNGLELYGKKTASKVDAGALLQDVKDTKTSQTIDKEQCKELVKLYYQSYETKREYPQQQFDNFKKTVQSCVNYYDKEGWGGIPIKLKKYVKILRSQVEGGPSLRGSDSKWRLN